MLTRGNLTSAFAAKACRHWLGVSLPEAGKQEEEYQLNIEEIDESFLLFKVYTYPHKQHYSGNASSLTQL